MKDRTLLTMAGAKKLYDELNQLKNKERQKIIQAVSEARAHGDLKENAEYHAAREKQSFIEGKIKHLQAKLANAEIVDPANIKNKSIVAFGAKVVIADLNDQHFFYEIVGEDESDIKNKKIAYTSPIAKALFGKKVGDEAIVQSPNGEVNYEIIEINYDSN